MHNLPPPSLYTRNFILLVILYNVRTRIDRETDPSTTIIIAPQPRKSPSNIIYWPTVWCVQLFPIEKWKTVDFVRLCTKFQFSWTGKKKTIWSPDNHHWSHSTSNFVRFFHLKHICYTERLPIVGQYVFVPSENFVPPLRLLFTKF